MHASRRVVSPACGGCGRQAPSKKATRGVARMLFMLVPAIGIELTTFALRMRCSTY